MKRFSIFDNPAAIEEIARMETDVERISGESIRARRFSTRLMAHEDFKFSSLFLEPTRKTTDALKGKRS